MARININTAPAATFTRLPGIGQALATRITEFREKHGSFESKRDLVQVQGISERMLGRIQHMIALSTRTRKTSQASPNDTPGKTVSSIKQDSKPGTTSSKTSDDKKKTVSVVTKQSRLRSKVKPKSQKSEGTSTQDKPKSKATAKSKSRTKSKSKRKKTSKSRSGTKRKSTSQKSSKSKNVAKGKAANKSRGKLKSKSKSKSSRKKNVRMPDLSASTAIQKLAKRANVSQRTMRAILKVVVRKKGFLKDGRPIVTFDGETFWKELKKRDINTKPLAKKYPGVVYKTEPDQYPLKGNSEYKRVNRALRIHPQAALLSTAWGKFGLRGQLYKAAGFKKLNAFVHAQHDSEVQQLDDFLNVLRTKEFKKALKAHKWQKFARLYFNAGANSQEGKVLKRAFQASGKSTKKR